MALMTHSRSSPAACARAAALGFGDEAVEDAVPGGLELDGRVGEADPGGCGVMVQGEIVDVPVCAGDVVST